MNKKEIVSSIAEKTGQTKVVVEEIVNQTLEVIGDTVAKGESVVLTGFGSFVSTLQKGKTGKVPGTDKTYTTQDKMVPKFKASKDLKEKVKSGK